MNISDVKIDYSKYAGRDRLDVLFEKQEELRKLYGIPILDLDLPRDQHLAREFAWNVTEEMGEVLDVYFGTGDKEHIKDEIADALSFYLELMLMSGMAMKDFIFVHSEDDGDDLEAWFFLGTGSSLKIPDVDFLHERVIHSLFLQKLALAINHLKNRKWRKTNLKTNKKMYREALLETFDLFIAFVQVVGLSSADLLDAYLRKSEVNMFRIRSKY